MKPLGELIYTMKLRGNSAEKLVIHGGKSVTYNTIDSKSGL